MASGDAFENANAVPELQQRLVARARGKRAQQRVRPAEPCAQARADERAQGAPARARLASIGLTHALAARAQIRPRHPFGWHDLIDDGAAARHRTRTGRAQACEEVAVLTAGSPELQVKAHLVRFDQRATKQNVAGSKRLRLGAIGAVIARERIGRIHNPSIHIHF